MKRPSLINPPSERHLPKTESGAFATAAISTLLIGFLLVTASKTLFAAASPASLEVYGDKAACCDPESEGLDVRKLLELTEWIRDRRLPVYSVLISRNGRLVYEFYTSALTRDHAHYQMSVTKSLVSALVGIAIDRGLIGGPDSSLTDTLPHKLFGTDANLDRFRSVTVRQVLGMSALDAPDPPRSWTPEALARQRQFNSATSRVAFALRQPVLAGHGRTFQYNDQTPMLATGLIQYASGKTAFDFAQEHLFGPMEFRNQEWMHQDRSGVDNGGYGIRLRPIDMQKFGLLYLNRGVWRGNVLISEEWVRRSFTPWNNSGRGSRRPDYGWFWWTHYVGARDWSALVANGWKGQRIAVLPQEKLVVTMTACIQDGTENRVFKDLIDKFVVQSVRGSTETRTNPEMKARLTSLLEEVRASVATRCPGEEARMNPSIKPKSKRVRFSARAMSEVHSATPSVR